MKYNKLTILKTWKKKRNTKGYREMAECLCDCGNKTVVQVENLKSGHTTSCGCERVRVNTVHGYSGHPLYTIWEGVVERCCNKNSKAYKWYGLRGIKMFDLWRNNPKEFIEWCLENGWMKGLSIEREDVNGNYEPSNCKFIPMVMQAKNTRKSMRLERNGITDTQRGWAKRLGLHPSTLRYRMKVGNLVNHFFGSAANGRKESKDEPVQ